MGATMTNPDLRRKIKVRMRPDLTVKEQRYGGHTYFIVKDPVSLRYYRFREEELFLLQQFDGKNTFDDIRHAFVERFRPQRLSVTELEKFVGQLLQAGIATAETPQIGQRLFERGKQQKKDKLKQMAMNILYIKVPIFDPERLLARMLPYTRFLFTIPFFLLVLTFGISSLMLVLVNWDTFVSKLPSYQEFFTPRNLMYFWLTLAIVKIMHEFGHGLSCKQFGGEVHEMGFLFLVLTPCLYCNVTDAWMLPSKWKRAIIGAAGIYVELILSSIFVWIWWFTEPGMLNTLSLSIIFICSVSTVLFNANPLLRFDGYYILADLLEIPNLRERSNKYLGNLASIVFFGSEAVEDPFMPKRRKWFFALYAVAAYLYRWVVSVGILFFLYTFLKPYKLGTISAMLGTAALFSLLVLPAWKVYKTVRMRWRSMKVNKVRMAFAIAVAAALVIAALSIPFPMHIDAPMVLRPENAASVYVQIPGMLKEVYVRDGDKVAEGTVLARLHDAEREKALAKLRIEHQQLQKAERTAISKDNVLEANQARLQARDKLQIIRDVEQELAKLMIKAPKAGTVLSPPKVPDLGRTFKPGELFCQIGDPTKLEAFIVIEHSDRSLIDPIKVENELPIEQALANMDESEEIEGQHVRLKLSGHVGSILQGSVARISNREIEELPQNLSNKYKGEVATTTNPETHMEVPLAKSYALQVAVPDETGTLVPGVRGYARIDIGSHNLYWRVKRYIQQTFHFRM